jgi:endonuclease YncB( thermonuclease family)
MKLILVFLACTVTDGDTLRCGQERIRIWGLDAPELSQRGGEASKRYLRSLTTGKRVTCTLPPVYARWRYSYRRRVARCFVDNKDLACEMIKAGHGKEWIKFSKGYYRDCR